jgi:hypothetical protein
MSASIEESYSKGAFIRVHAPSNLDAAANYSPGDTITGIQECDPCLFELVNVRDARVFIDDVEVRPDESGRYAWTPTFLAGRVEIVIAPPHDDEISFYLLVGPAAKKVVEAQFDAMVDEIRSFKASLLLGTSSATTAFGNEGSRAAFEELIRLARLRRHAHPFLRALRTICHRPHRSISHAEHRVPLARAKRLHPRALREPRVAAIVRGGRLDEASPDSVQVATSTAVQTFDTPANRAVKALAFRFQAQISSLIESLESARMQGDGAEQLLRRPRREHFLRGLLHELKPLLQREPFASVSRLEASAASLTQISAQPVYSNAYRQGGRALLRGVNGTGEEDHLFISPTWGVYENWCFVHLLAKLAQSFGNVAWRRTRRGIVSAMESYELKLADGTQVEAHFQANFASRSAESGRSGWSISRMRIPDIVFVLKSPTRFEFLVLDAKYRRHRDNVLEAMESAHIYHDSLRAGMQRPAFCGLLLPAVPDVPHLEADAFLLEHGVGTFSQFSPGAPGIQRCIDFVTRWIRQSVSQNTLAEC